MRIAETIEIGRSPEEIWAFVADHGNDPAWCKKVKSTEALGPRKWRTVHKPVPLRPELTLIVEQLELDPPWRLKLRETDDASVFEVEYRLEAAGTATRFAQISDFEWKRSPWFLRRAFAHGVRRDVRNQLRTLKRVLETQEGGLAPGMSGGSRMTRRPQSRIAIARATVSRALGGLSADGRRRVIGLLVLAAVTQLRIFVIFERQMKRTGGPGIIPFELAGSTVKARQIIDTWGSEGRSAARRSLLLDFVFPPTYAALQALSCDAASDALAKRGRRSLAAAGTAIAWAQPAAAIFDYVENTALLLVLAGRDRWAPSVARRAALAKFALVSLGQGYIVLRGLPAAGGAKHRRRQ